MTKTDFLGYLHNGDFTSLFVECGWNRPSQSRPLSISIDGKPFAFREVAQKGLRIFVCEVDAIPAMSVVRSLDSRIRKYSHDYFSIFTLKGDAFHHLWSVPVNGVDKRQLVTVEYVQDSQAEFLKEKLDGITFGIDEEVAVVDVIDRVTKAFLVNSEKVTKSFYQGFSKQHKAFVKGIENIPAEEDREWYASVMLNRLMFCYFLQKKGFLDYDESYLGNKLKWVKEKRGENKFLSFYRSFLKNLFNDGLDRPCRERSDYFRRTYGNIPYLNGGMFAKHELERRYPDIDIPDSVFEALFGFFDDWRWHLDSRLTETGKDINPDVLGYIFEQYINDRAQMGAYYTKEDITEYITRNTLVPWLLNETAKSSPGAFAKNGYVWKSLRESGDRYIFPAVKKGVDRPLPPEIERGVAVEPQNTLRKRRAEWNRPAADDLALPTEIWRETVARRQRCEELRRKIVAGEITDVNDFITFNLDIRAFAEDLVRNAKDHLFVKHFYDALRKVTVLDPTCGSGAFLFAALNVMEPLYETCLDRIGEFHEKDAKLFNDELNEIKGKFRSNQKYFIYKNIILRNLYGVDIMREATEIARLRLFLKMVAAVDVDPQDENLGLDPLPDIDFNIRCGNTLVGFANPQGVRDAILPPDQLALDTEAYDKVERKAADVADLYEIFKREQQNAEGSTAYYTAKRELASHLAELNAELDRAMAYRIYGINSDTVNGNKEFVEWKSKSLPFHWYSEFYGITVANGGFDVVIGNPPYVNIRKVCYLPSSERFSCSDLYGYVIRRSIDILSSSGRHGFIVMHNLAFSKDFKDTRKILLDKVRSLWCSFYARIPSGLFSSDGGEGARVRNCIYITSNRGETHCTTRLHRWFTDYRTVLFQNLQYCAFDKCDVFPMFNDSVVRDFLLCEKGKPFSMFTSGKEIFYQATGYNYLCVTEKPAPCYDGLRSIASASKALEVSKQYWKEFVLLFCGKITLLRWLTYGDDFHITLKPFLDSRISFDSMTTVDKNRINSLYAEFERRLPDTLQFKLNCGKRIGSYNISKLWDITDQSDAIFLKYLCDNPVQVHEAIESHISSCVITGRKGVCTVDTGED